MQFPYDFRMISEVCCVILRLLYICTRHRVNCSYNNIHTIASVFIAHILYLPLRYRYVAKISRFKSTQNLYEPSLL